MATTKEVVFDFSTELKFLSELHKSTEDCRAIFIELAGSDWYEGVDRKEGNKLTILFGRHQTQMGIWDNGEIILTYKGSTSGIDVFGVVDKFRELKYKPKK